MNHELAIIEPEYVDVFDEPDDSDGLRKEIDSILLSIRNQELTLATSHARLGWKLLKVQKQQHWKQWGFESFGKYIDSVKTYIHRGRASIYNCISVAEKLLPSISEKDLDHMGISRAQELARFVKQSGRSVPEHLLNLALDDSKRIEELHVAVLEELHEKQDPKGSWHDVGGFYALPEEKKELEQAYNHAKNMLQLGSDAPEHQVRKEIILAWARDFVSTNPIE
jgi:hypothetical protein